MSGYIDADHLERMVSLAWETFQLSIVPDNCEDVSAIENQRRLFADYQDLKRQLDSLIEIAA